jgi:hypothetical protein
VDLLDSFLVEYQGTVWAAKEVDGIGGLLHICAFVGNVLLNVRPRCQKHATVNALVTAVVVEFEMTRQFVLIFEHDPA